MRGILRCLIVLLLTIVLAAGAAALTSSWWLPALGRFLVTEDRLAPADLLVVLSGAASERAGYAVDLFRKGYAPRILCASSLVPADLALIGKRLTYAQLTAAALEDAGIPEDDIVVINLGTSTFEELTIVRDRMLAEGWKRAILVSSPYHLRRVRLTWNQVNKDDHLEAILRASPYARFHTTAWWRHERDLLSVQNEYAKLLYYELLLFRGIRIDEPDDEGRRGTGLLEKKHRGEDAAMPSNP